jgi:hypothetical protein
MILMFLFYDEGVTDSDCVKQDVTSISTDEIAYASSSVVPEFLLDDDCISLSSLDSFLNKLQSCD